MAFLPSKIWTQQPQQSVEIDWSNPITRGMSLCVGKERINAISGKAATVVGTKYTVGQKGIASGFGATFGAGTTDSITTDLAAHATYRTYLSVATRNGIGGGSGGRLFEKRTAGAAIEAWYNNAGGATLDFWKQYGGGTALLTVPVPANNKPFVLAIAIDSTAPGSFPSCFKDGVKVTVSGTTSGGTATTNSDAYVIGNRTNDNARNWDGEIYLTVFWDRLLSDTELASVTANPWQIFKPFPSRIFASASGGSSVTGTLSATEAAETLSSAGTVSGGAAVTGTLAATNDNETLTAAGNALVGASLSAAEAPETISSSGSLAVGATLSATESAETASSSGSLSIGATLSATESAETASSSGSLAIGATLSATEAAETVSSSGSISISASLAATESAETLSAAGSIVSGVVGTASITQASETAAASGSVAIGATASNSEAAEALSASASVPVGGTASMAQSGQTVVSSGNIQITGAGALVELAETLAASGLVLNGVTGSASLIMAAQTLAAFGSGSYGPIARPQADTSNSGWVASSGTDLYAMIDETAMDNADYVSTSSAGSVYVFKLSGASGLGASQKLQCSAWSSTGNGVRFQLYQGDPSLGGTLITTWEPTLATVPPSTPLEYSLTSGEIASISDYGNLYIKQTSI